MKKIIDNVKRNSWGKCVVCGDTALTQSGDCFYCNWKGNTGPGVLLKEAIHELNTTVKNS